MLSLQCQSLTLAARCRLTPDAVPLRAIAVHKRWVVWTDSRMYRHQRRRTEMFRKVILIGVILFFPGALLGQVFYPPATLDDLDSTLVVTMAAPYFDTQPPHLSIEGRNFGLDPQVFFGREGGGLEALPVLISSDNFIDVLLPDALPGTYLVIVSSGVADSQNAGPRRSTGRARLPWTTRRAGTRRSARCSRTSGTTRRLGAGRCDHVVCPAVFRRKSLLGAEWVQRLLPRRQRRHRGDESESDSPCPRIRYCWYTVN